MSSDRPVGPYRSPAPREQVPRPLEPEDEMRLLLQAAEAPRGTRAWMLVAFTLLGLGVLVWSILDRSFALAALYFVVPGATAIVARLRYQRRVAQLRKEGYDVDGLAAQLRDAEEPRIRIDPSIDGSDAATEDHASGEGEGEETAPAARMSRR